MKSFAFLNNSLLVTGFSIQKIEVFINRYVERGVSNEKNRVPFSVTAHCPADGQ